MCVFFILLNILWRHKNLQLLEVTARAVHLVAEWEEPGLIIADGLSNLLKVAVTPLCNILFTRACL